MRAEVKDNQGRDLICAEAAAHVQMTDDSDDMGYGRDDSDDMGYGSDDSHDMEYGRDGKL